MTKIRSAAAWAGAAAVYAAAQGVSAWAAQRGPGASTRARYDQFRQPGFAPPGWAFPVAWSALNLTTATSAWLAWRASPPSPLSPALPSASGPSAAPSSRALRWWAAAVLVRSGYVPLAFGRGRLWAATADAALLSAVMARYAWLARQADPAAGLLALPEVAWSAFATVLSTAVALENGKPR